MQFLRIILVTIYIVVVTHSFEMKYYKWEQISLFIKGTPVQSFSTDLSTACAAACRLLTDCFLYFQDGNTCQLFDNLTQVQYDTERAFPLAVGLDRSKLPPNPIPGTEMLLNYQAVVSLGTYWPFIYCDPYTVVNGIKIWNDHYDGPLRNLTDDGDDQGVTQIEMICSTQDGVVANSLKQGNDVDGALLNEFMCPPGSFISGLRPYFEHIKTDDKVGMLVINVQCNDPEQTQMLTARNGFRGEMRILGWQMCPAGYHICGFSLNVLEENTTDNTTDNTAVNEIKTMCCFY